MAKPKSKKLHNLSQKQISSGFFRYLDLHPEIQEKIEGNVLENDPDLKAIYDDFKAVLFRSCPRALSAVERIGINPLELAFLMFFEEPEAATDEEKAHVIEQVESLLDTLAHPERLLVGA